MERSRHLPPGAATRHLKLGNAFPSIQPSIVDSAIGASNVRPPTDATQSRPYPMPHHPRHPSPRAATRHPRRRDAFSSIQPSVLPTSVAHGRDAVAPLPRPPANYPVSGFPLS